MRDEKVPILRTEKLTDSYFKLIVHAPHIAKTAQPGQFVLIRVEETTDPLLRRPLGVYRIKQDEVHFLVQIVGHGTSLLARKNKGDMVWVLGPLGHGFTVADSKRSIMVAGGVGIVPLVYLGEASTAERLFFGAKTKEQLISQGEIGRIAKHRQDATEDGSLGYRGLISECLEQFLEKESRPQDCFLYVSGPRGLIRKASELASRFNVQGEATLDERMACGVGACLGCAVKTNNGTKMVCKDGPVFTLDELVF